ncbi:hypothetical protein Ahy_B08g089968 [Arachis hypogaea]|uniref:Uncharacterized protein n=1 Tax=Arachis hypogaea TaxID=3818 RepID=A0A444XZ81_ARAHY|nr:hypothetical protein Ahy_B08g089968 [Arachis hypogaea]
MTTCSRGRSSGSRGRGRGRGSSSGPAVHHGPKLKLCASYCYAPLRIQQRQILQWVIPLVPPKKMPPTTACDPDENLARRHVGVHPDNNACTQEITEVIRSMYDDAWSTYTKVPTKVRERWFQKLGLKFTWDQEHALMIRKIFDHRAAKRLQQMMNDLRQGRTHLTTWILADIKRRLDTHFAIDEGFKYHCLTNVSQIGLHRGCPDIRSKSLDHEATLAEMFKYTHALKANKERFVDKQSATHYVNIKSL